MFRLLVLFYILVIIDRLDSITIPPVLFKENRIIATKEYLISLSIESDTLYRVFSLPNCEYKGGFGRIGKGQNEFLNAVINGLRINEGGCNVADSKAVYSISLPLGEKINFDNAIVKCKYLIPGLFYPFNDPTIVNDTMVFGRIDSGATKELACFNPISGKIDFLIEYPEIVPNVPLGSKGHLYHGYINLSPDKTKIAKIYQRFPLLRISNIEGDVLHEVFINEGPRQKKEIGFTRHSINTSNLFFYYDQACVTDLYIYASFQVFRFNIDQGANQSQIINESNKQLHVFNWEGELIAKILLEDWMKVYTVSLDDGYIYFLHPDRENRIFRYSLSAIL